MPSGVRSATPFSWPLWPHAYSVQDPSGRIERAYRRPQPVMDVSVRVPSASVTARKLPRGVVS